MTKIETLETLEKQAAQAHAGGNLEQALHYYEQVLRIIPTNISCLLHYSEILFGMNRLGEASQHLRTVVAAQPDNVMALSNLGYVLHLLGEGLEAEKICNLALQYDHRFAAAHCNLGIILLGKDDYNQAEQSFQKGIDLDPLFSRCWTNLAIIYKKTGRLTEALNAGKKALHLDPSLVEGYCNQGISLLEAMRHDEAIELFRTGAALNPHYPAVQSNMLMGLQYVPGKSSKELQGAAAMFTTGIEPLEPLSIQNSRTASANRLRIGYMSGDFYRHPVGWFLLRILAAHDRNRVEIFCYDTGGMDDNITCELREQADHWHLVQNKTTHEGARLIAEHGIDVLVDLAGHTAGNRLDIFAMKPAAVQISWLGYFASTGLKTMDYVLLGKDQAPPGSQSYFTEKLHRLSHCQFCYSPPDYSPPVQDSPHVKKGMITFGCFNNSAKLNYDVFALWCQILHNVPGSRLILKWLSFQDRQFCSKVVNIFSRAGIHPDRLELRGASPHVEMLDQYGDIDIALDPFPFSGALTSCEALWMGVPVVTFAQQRPVSRQSLAVLKAIGLDSLTGYTPRDYLRISKDLAQNSDLLVSLRNSLRQKLEQSTLWSGDGLARELEDAYHALHRERRVP